MRTPASFPRVGTPTSGTAGVRPAGSEAAGTPPGETPSAGSSADATEPGEPGEPAQPAGEPGEPGGEPEAVPDAFPGAAAAAPPVVAVVVTSDPGPWLEATLTSLGEQDYPGLSVLVLDNGSREDPTARVAAAMPHAFVHRRDVNAGFAAAANDAIAMVEGATFFLFCHDDVALESNAVGVMVEEAYRSNAGIVGPKLVDYDDPKLLLEVGMTIDHYGIPFSGIEPGEIDQEQHDAVRDVFYVSDASMLVRTDLFRDLGGFDPATFPGFDDVDLCWRARLAGARVLVAPDARVRHRRATVQDVRPSRDESRMDYAAWTRNRLRVLVKSYAGLALLWVLPLAFVLNVFEAAAFVLTRRSGRARALLSGWFANLRELGDLRRARSDAQRLRRVDDDDVRDLMVRGSARVRAFVTHRLHAGDRLADMSYRTRSAVARVGSRVRNADAILAGVLLVLLAAGSRSLVFGRVPELGWLRDWPGAGELWSTFVSPWRYAMVGSDAPGPPAFGLMAFLSALLLGDTDLARMLVVVGALPLGAAGAYRLARPLAASRLPAVLAAVAYVANPVARNAIGEGHLGPLVSFALAPFVLAALFRAGAAEADRRARVHGAVVVALLGAIAGAAWPPALLLAPFVAVALFAAVPVSGGLHLALRTGAIALAAALGAFVVLSPWAIGVLGGGAAPLGLVPRDPLGLAEVLAFQTGPAGSGPAPAGLVAAALLPFVGATGPRLAWASRAWMLTLLSWTVAWLPGRLGPDLPVPAREGLLVPAAVGLALAIGLGAAAFLEELRTFHFGWRQLAAVAAALGLALPVLGLAVDARDGRWRLPGEDWAGRFAWMGEGTDEGGLRVLWLGDPTVLPTDAHVVGGVAYGLTRDGVGDARSLWAPAPNGAERELARAVRLLRDGHTTRFGHLLAPIGVRYIAVLERPAPDAGRRRRVDPRVLAGLATQLDLHLASVESTEVVYENEAWFARRALADPDADVPVASEDPLAIAGRTTLTGEPVTGRQSRSAPTGPGTVLWAEAADAGWRGRSDGRALERGDAFGWTNAFRMPESGRLSIAYDAGIAHRAAVVLQITAWVALVAAWWRTRRPVGRGSDGERGRHAARGTDGRR